MSNVVKQVAQDILFAEIRSMLSQGSHVQLRVRGRSMRPMLEHERDLVTLEHKPAHCYRRGDIVLASTSDQRWVLHRIVRCDKLKCTLQGDGNVGQQEECQRVDIIGRVVSFQRKTRQFSVDHWIWQIYANVWQTLVYLRRPLLLAYELLHHMSIRISSFK